MKTFLLLLPTVILIALISFVLTTGAATPCAAAKKQIHDQAGREADNMLEATALALGRLRDVDTTDELQCLRALGDHYLNDNPIHYSLPIRR